MTDYNFKTPRLRMFAGPNGSGKSTLKSVIDNHLIGLYINPDELEKEIAQYDFLDFDAYDIHVEKEEVLRFFDQSNLLAKADLLEEAECLKFNDNKLSFFEVSINAYFASVCADFIRRKLLEKRASFTFETVMSAPDKVELLKTAKQLGYRTYLYYIATNDPEINIARVQQRVQKGGHDVPKDKIVSRYTRSLKNLSKAIEHSDRAYLFDNSGDAAVWMCEITNGKTIEYKQEVIPYWLDEYVVEALR